MFSVIFLPPFLIPHFQRLRNRQQAYRINLDSLDRWYWKINRAIDDNKKSSQGAVLILFDRNYSSLLLISLGSFSIPPPLFLSDCMLSRSVQKNLQTFSPSPFYLRLILLFSRKSINLESCCSDRQIAADLRVSQATNVSKFTNTTDNNNQTSNIQPQPWYAYVAASKVSGAS